MATTAGGTPYVESSDLVANYPAVSLALAEHIDDLPAAILQVVRATDTTSRSTTSTSAVDVTGMSVTITPQKSDSAILIIVSVQAYSEATADSNGSYLFITDASDNLISGGEQTVAATYLTGYTGGGTRRIRGSTQIIAYATPATTSAVTYKLRMAVDTPSTTVLVKNERQTGQIFAIEVSA